MNNICCAFDVNRFSGYTDINGNNLAIYCEKRTDHWKAYIDLENRRVKYYEFENKFNAIMRKLVKSYHPQKIKINTKLKLKPVTFCKQHGYRFEREGNRLMLYKVQSI